ncbi:hypothetical protein [Streptomyces sp. V2I9]|uniref:hypothetical protein n=1 Tax=Streptomyces sp. V2I9 TaxID=3042304 RepID=UPI0027892056|nr:hypothetical protein [Streptomyces sp. V2I9]MDQ0986605.1 hypothetical protein [Streptomyces sp. V2I9]
MPHWITPRRLGATAVLYAVFVGGWYLGQPLPHVGCEEESTAASSVPVTIGEPGDVSDDFTRTARDVGQFVTHDLVSTEALVACDPYTARPRLVAWATGDWR